MRGGIEIDHIIDIVTIAGKRQFSGPVNPSPPFPLLAFLRLQIAIAVAFAVYLIEIRRLKGSTSTVGNKHAVAVDKLPSLVALLGVMLYASQKHYCHPRAQRLPAAHYPFSAAWWRRCRCYAAPSPLQQD